MLELLFISLSCSFSLPIFAYLIPVIFTTGVSCFRNFRLFICICVKVLLVVLPLVVLLKVGWSELGQRLRFLPNFVVFTLFHCKTNSEGYYMFVDFGQTLEITGVFCEIFNVYHVTLFNERISLFKPQRIR